MGIIKFVYSNTIAIISGHNKVKMPNIKKAAQT